MIKVIVDAFGGDRSPEVNVTGAIRAINEIDDLQIVLVGDETKLKELLLAEKYDTSRVEIVHAPDVISCNDVPTVAIKRMTESSMVKAYDLLKTDDCHALVSLGSTGALLAGAVLKIGRIKGVKRPAFCPVLPTMNGKVVGICDSGANVDCDPMYLQQFALMGSLYMQKTYGVENPRVALLNIGVEEAKGDQRSKEAYQLLKNNTPAINFVGNMEARELLTGDYDVVTCDGFSGNVLLKSTEGTGLEMLKLIKKAFTSNFKSKLGALLLKKKVYEIKDMMDYNNYGGSVLLGAKKTIVKGHGSSKATAVYNCVKQAYNMEKTHLCEAIGEEIAKLMTPAEQPQE